MGSRIRCDATAWVALLFAWATAGLAQSPGEAQLKAAFVWNFTKFVEWPSPSLGSAGRPMHLCVAGQGPVKRFLHELEGGVVQGRPLQVRSIASAAEVKGCHVLFIANTIDFRPAELLRIARAAPILTIGDVAGFADAGGIIGLVKEDDRLRFEVNLASARDSRLGISAQLLKLASAIKQQAP